MSESAWWREELWWEKGLFQLGGSSISARQLGTLSALCIFALLASLPASFSIDGISFAGRLSAFGSIVLVGYFGVVQRRVKMVPLELQLFFWVTKGRPKAKAKAAASATGSKPKAVVETLEIQVDDFENPTPLSFAGRVRVGRATTIRLVVGGEVRDEAPVTPEGGDYRLIYTPLPKDVGVKEGTVMLVGADKPLSSFKVVVSAKGVGLLESREHSR